MAGNHNMDDNMEVIDLDIGDFNELYREDGNPGRLARRDRYVSLVERIRRRLGELGREVSIAEREEDKKKQKQKEEKEVKDVLWMSRTCPVLPREADTANNETPRMFQLRLHATLQDGTRTWVSLIIRRDNLYLIGYRTANGERWTLNTNLLPGYQPILRQGTNHNDENYGSLVRASDYCSPTDVPLGRQALLDAVTMLTSSGPLPGTSREVDGGQQRKQQARALLIFCFMFCEAARSEPVLQYIVLKWFIATTRVQQWILELVLNWRSYSRSVLLYDSCVNRSPPPDEAKDEDANSNRKYYVWKPQTLKVESSVLTRIDPTMKGDINRWKEEQKKNQVLKGCRVTEVTPVEIKDKEGNVVDQFEVVEFSVQTVAQMLAYIGILLLGTIKLKNLVNYPPKRGD